MNKRIAPIITAVIVLICIGLYGVLWFYLLNLACVLPIIRIALFILFLAIGGGLLYALKQRLSEIKEEENDDLSKY